ncbi:signal transduction histidine kinase, LytS [Mahella australiensis 50-1 BON]|uniref:Signal transduction histidine kinase, LytS n=1 Tax=Mahella australiensis (strain DSM 15567 / CIP 107919 / 50-1 BON) TaxID=697281 RepID=F4A117_MAHA5|nr:signal transduction histidine kinase, LytS [Mahella australiensis 50-1 BON]
MQKFNKLMRMITPRGMANKLFAMICFIWIFITISLICIVTNVSGNLLYKFNRNLLDNQAKQTVNVFDQYMDILRNTVMTVSREDNVKALISGDNEGYKAYLVYRDSYTYIKNIHEFYDWMNIYIIVKDKNYIMSSNPRDVVTDYDKKGIPEMRWYKYLEDGVKETHIMSDFIPPVSSNREQFAYALNIRNIYKWDIEGYIIATIDKNVLDDLVRGTSFEKNGFMLVLNDNGQVAYNSDPSILGDDLPIEQLSNQIKDSGNYAFGINKDFYYSSWKSRTSGWNFIAFADKKYAEKEVLDFQLLVFSILIVAILLLIIVARFVSDTYSKPIKQILRFIHDIEKKEFAGQIDLELEDEMGDLINSFNAMIASVRQNQVLKKKAEIDALQKQINPHFLFNTFQSIKALAQQNDSRSVIMMIEKLSDMFHYNMNRDKSPMTEIRYEIEHVRNYLDIQRVRYGNRMEVFYDIDDRILPYWTLKFILQPIVENSISHSMEQMSGGYRLDIRGGFDGDDIVFVIRDNGVGIPEEKLIKLREYIYDKSGTVENDNFGIGLRNIHERLYLLYGDGYGLTVDSVLGRYTEICVRISKMDRKEAMQSVNYIDRG